MTATILVHRNGQKKIILWVLYHNGRKCQMWEFEFWNKTKNQNELFFGYSYDDAIKNCDHKNDLTYIGCTYID